MKKTFLFSLISLFVVACTQKQASNFQKEDLTQYVNPFIGTAFTGHTFPGATYPFGMIQAGPQTGNFSWEYCAGYVYEDSLIQGFTQNRLNGTGCIDLGDLLIQPFSGPKRDNLSSKYDKSAEKASPGYYSVLLPDNDVLVEITTTPHVAFHKYTYAAKKPANLLIDFQSGLVWTEENMQKHILDNNIKFESSTMISGYTRRTEWVEREYYFVIEFDKPILVTEQLDKRDPREKASRYIMTFDMKKDSTLNMKIAMSSVSVEGAKANLKAEVPSWDFEAVHNQVKNEWNNYLSRIRIEGDNSQKTNFYTALYHTFIQPNNIADVDGKYKGPNRQISQSSSGKFYSTWSQWDTFRAAFPLYTVVVPDMIPDFVNSMLDYSEQQGHLPVWSLWGQETYTMIGSHSVPMVVDAYLKGFKGFDAERAYKEIKKSLTVNTRDYNWGMYDRYGYFPFDSVRVEAASSTLECGFDDYSVALMAQKLGKSDDYDFFIKRSNYYKNLFDPETKYMRARDSKGNWRTPFDPLMLAHGDSDVGGDYTEANAAQYTWHVLQDIPELLKMMGDNKMAAERLDSLFYTTAKSTNTLSDVTGLIGQYAHGNEPSHHIAYIYTYLGQSYKTQELIRKIYTDFYKDQPDGLIGNDDCGQMSAWYVLSSLGFYPVNPVSGEFVFGAPQIPSAKINVDNGKVFSMEAKNLSESNKYVEKIELNGILYDKQTISYKDIMNGASLIFYMTDIPKK
jgi:predicted alpha-1,2-mannosidase